VTFFQLPCGARCIRVNVRGAISDEEAITHLNRVDDPEGDLHGLPALTYMHEMESITPGARHRFAIRVPQEPWVAVVVTSPVLRVALNFLQRVRGRKKLRMFTADPEALKWLDDRVREELAAKPPPGPETPPA
jgi:hypothetical protein